jgi:uncharacterized protein
LDDKLNVLNAILHSMGQVLIGYSGGVDSALLIVAAHKALGPGAIAVTADSESYASGELERAQEITQHFGIRHEVVHTQELQNPEYAANPTNRCYFCKQELFTHMQRLSDELSVPHILYGQNLDDVGDFRPGAQAAKDYNVRAPLKEAGFTKDDVRQLARRWNLEVWDRPAMACLSSRFPYGTAITADQLSMVDRAEAHMHEHNFTQLRVRHHSDIARIELPAEDLSRLLAGPGPQIGTALAALGYRRVTADLQGFRSGSMNEVLLPMAVDETESLQKARALLTEIFPGPAELEKRQQMLCLALPQSAHGQLVDAAIRADLVQRLQNLGFHYLTLDLCPFNP